MANEAAQAAPVVSIDAVPVFHTDPSTNPPTVTRYMLAPIDAEEACDRFPNSYSMSPPAASVQVNHAPQPASVQPPAADATETTPAAPTNKKGAAASAS